jgi:hypothetical protein
MYSKTSQSFVIKAPPSPDVKVLLPKKEIEDANESVPVYLSPYLPKNHSQLSSIKIVLGNLFFNIGTSMTLPML